MLRFVDRREIDSVAGLSDAQRAQLRAAGALYDGEDLPAEVRLDPDRDEGSFHGTCEVWRILDGDRYAYDAWLYMGDSGTIFRAGTTDMVAEIVQCGLECSDRRLRVEIGPAMVAARLLPQTDASFGEFAEILAKQQAGVVLAPILAEGTMPAPPSGLEEVSPEELAELVTAESADVGTPRVSKRAIPSPKKAAKGSKAGKPKTSAKVSSAKTSSAKAKTSPRRAKARGAPKRANAAKSAKSKVPAKRPRR